MIQNKYSSFLFVLPCIAILIAINVYPLLYSLYISVHTLSFKTREMPFVGAANYLDVLRSYTFWVTLKVTSLFVVITITVEIILGCAMALLLNRNLKGRRFIIPLVSLPMMVTPIAAATIWKFMYLPSWGILNYFLSFVRINPVSWLSGTYLPLISITFVDIWQWTPFVTLLILAGLQGLPQSPYEAAAIDGATSWQRFSSITLPLLRPTFLVVLLLRTIDSLKVFDTVYVLTTGGPGHATEVLSMHAFILGFKYFRMGRATAFCYVMLVIISIIALYLIKLLSTEENV